MNYRSILFFLGRLFFGSYFIFSGSNLLLHFVQTAAIIQAKGLIFPELFAAISGLLIILGGLGLLIGWYPGISVLLILLFMVPVTLIMHNFWNIEDPQMKTMQMMQFFGNLATIGALLMFLSIPKPWPFSLPGNKKN